MTYLRAFLAALTATLATMLTAVALYAAGLPDLPQPLQAMLFGLYLLAALYVAQVRAEWR